jgi:hypothetical protein
LLSADAVKDLPAQLLDVRLGRRDVTHDRLTLSINRKAVKESKRRVGVSAMSVPLVRLMNAFCDATVLFGRLLARCT